MLVSALRPQRWAPARYVGLVQRRVQDVSVLLAQAADYVLADELTHVRFGSDWSREFTKDDPDRAERAKEFQRETERAFSFGGREIAREERLEAGFTEEELDEIEQLAALHEQLDAAALADEPANAGSGGGASAGAAAEDDEEH